LQNAVCPYREQKVNTLQHLAFRSRTTSPREISDTLGTQARAGIAGVGTARMVGDAPGCGRQARPGVAAGT